MANLIEERVSLAREGKNPYLIGKMKSGWLVIGDVQPLPGYCVLLADPVVPSLNDLPEAARVDYLLDTARIGDALLRVTNAYRINYETLGNSDPALHTHITPRYLEEAAEKRSGPVMVGYDKKNSRKFDPSIDGDFVKAMRKALNL